MTIVKEVADDLVAGFAGYGVGVLKEAGDEDDEEDFEDRVRFDQGDLAESSRPKEVTFAK